MEPVLSVYQRWGELEVAGAPRILTCAYCVLLEWEHDDLASPFWRWYWNDRPGAYLILPHQRVPIEPGRVVLIPPHTVFGTGCEGPFGHLYVHFALGLDRVVTPGRIFQHQPTPAELLLIRRLVAAADGGGGASPLEVSFWVQALVNGALASIPSGYWDGRLTDACIAQALEILSRDGGEGGNPALARKLGMNTNAFIRRFVQATGHSPHQYRLRLRVERAAAWLREGRTSIEQIAEEAGFCDRFHFSRVFKQLMGASPARYRRGARVSQG